MEIETDIDPASDQVDETFDELRYRYRFYRSIVEKALDCAAIVDPKGFFQFVSPSVKHILGYEAQELIGLNAFDFFHPEEMLQLTAIFRNGMETPEKVASIEHKFRHKDGSWRVLEVVGTNLSSDPIIKGALINFRDITGRKEIEARVTRMNRELMEETEHRKVISLRLTQLLEQDRRSLALDLHDHVGQMLTTLKMDISAAESNLGEAASSASFHLKNAHIRANQIMESLRRIARGLLPSELDDLGLISSLRSLCMQVQESAGIHIRFFSKNISDRFDSQKELAVYRVAQEALNNVAKHSRAREVHVSLTTRHSKVSLCVEDDGIGFHPLEIRPHKNPGSLGLLYMKERLYQVQGELRLESWPGQGTVVWAEIPI